MDRRRFLRHAAAGAFGLGVFSLSGCRSRQTAQVLQPGQADMVGSHVAGAETYKPLVDEAVGQLLARHGRTAQPANYVPGEQGPPPLRICFVGVENKSSEEIGDFKEQIYQNIDTRIVQSQLFQPISRRFVDAGLRETRLRPDELFMPQNMRVFVASMEQMGQPFDYLLYATLTSGTTRSNKDYQRDYLLTLEIVNVANGQYDKESANLSKGYNVSAGAKLRNMTPFK
ncbi:MAG: penicillin-binding protein activator LpoB [Pirellulales bacterium]